MEVGFCPMPRDNSEKPRPDQPDRNNLMFLVGKYGSLAMSLPAATFVGYAIGYGLDHWLGTTFLKLVFLLIGIAAGFVELIRGLNRDQ
jgi:F0F1-type ATP synthase assembly protein I